MSMPMRLHKKRRKSWTLTITTLIAAYDFWLVSIRVLLDLCTYFLAGYVGIVGLSGSSSDLGTWAGISQVALLGALGAAVSGILRIGGDWTARRIRNPTRCFWIFQLPASWSGLAVALCWSRYYNLALSSSQNVDDKKFAIVLAFAAGFT